MALYHTYRPQSFADVLGQPHIVAVLQNALVHDRIGHAYLFSGPRGVGKTSIARILAKAINCEASSKLKTQSSKPSEQPKTIPCNECPACTAITDGSALDVIEIDAASNRGIDEIRELRDRVRFAPTMLAKKVYIIDEVHMLTKEAFNALLKTLEEPPDHAVFILATTELAKIPETIFSRCQHFQFRRAAPDALASHVQAVIAAEARTIEPDALELVLLRAEGSYRDALSAVEQVLVADDASIITAERVRSLFGLPAESTALELLAAIAAGDTEYILATLQAVSAQGVSLENFTTELIRVVRLLVFVATLGADRTAGGSDAFRTAAPALLRSFDLSELLRLLTALVRAATDARTSSLPTLPLELALLGFRQPTQPTAAPKESRVPRVTDVSMPPVSEASTPVSPQPAPMPVTGEAAVSTSESRASVSAKTAEVADEQSPASFKVADWSTLRRTIASTDSALGMLVAELERPTIAADTVTLTVPFQFHADQLQTKRSMSLLAKLFAERIGHPVVVRCVVAPSTRQNRVPERSTEATGTVLADPVAALSDL